MNVQEYIESGKLESYVLGTCSSEEMQEAECMARIFPEVKIEAEAIRTAFENYVWAHQVEPPSALKSKIFNAIADQRMQVNTDEGKIIPLQNRTTNTGVSWRLLIAAAFGLLLISVYVSYDFSKRNEELTMQVAELTSEQQVLQNNFSDLQINLNNTNKQIAIISNPSSVVVTMKGLAISSESLTTVYWNKDSKEVLLSVNSLPTAPTGKQYQLWAIVNSLPVDLGVFDLSANLEASFHEMKAVEGATTFAITLEQAGGSASPTMDQMYVAGNI